MSDDRLNEPTGRGTARSSILRPIRFVVRAITWLRARPPIRWLGRYQPENLPRRPLELFKWIVTSLVLIGVMWSWAGLNIPISRVLEAPRRGWTVARLMYTRMTWADLPGILEAMWESIAIAWIGTMIAAVLALPLAFVAASNLVGHPVALAVRQVLNALRAVPEIVLVVVFLPIFGFGPKAGVMAIGIGSIGTLGRLCYEVIESIDRGPIEAADAAGATKLQRLRWSVVPQVAPEMAAFVLYRFEINIRVSAILGAVGAGGIGQVVRQALQLEIPINYGRAGLALLVIILATIAVDTISGAVRRRIIRGPDTTPDEAPPEPVLEPV